MTSAITTEHKGYTMTYRERDDDWFCYDLSESPGKPLRAPSLAVLRKKVDSELLAMRKEHAVECLSIRNAHSTNPEFYPVTVTAYSGPTSLPVTGSKVGDDHYVSVMVPERGKFRREQRRLSDLFPINLLDTEAYEAFRAAVVDARVAANRVGETRMALPRLTLDDLAVLVQLSKMNPNPKLVEIE